MRRSNRDYLTEQEIAEVEHGFRKGHKASSVAADLGCGACAIRTRFRKLRGEGVPRGHAPRKPKTATPFRIRRPPIVERPQLTEQERRASRFYRSNFEL